MRPLFAIAPLALALALFGPTSQASTSAERSWTDTAVTWVIEQTNDLLH
jgi:hypothetical protein